MASKIRGRRIDTDNSTLNSLSYYADGQAAVSVTLDSEGLPSVDVPTVGGDFAWPASQASPTPTNTAPRNAEKP